MQHHAQGVLASSPKLSDVLYQAAKPCRLSLALQCGYTACLNATSLAQSCPECTVLHQSYVYSIGHLIRQLSCYIQHWACDLPSLLLYTACCINDSVGTIVSLLLGWGCAG